MSNRHLSILLLTLLLGGMVLAAGVLVVGPRSVEDQTIEMYEANQELHAEQGALRIWETLRDVEVRLATSASHKWTSLDDTTTKEDLQEALTRLSHSSDDDFGITLAVLDEAGEVLAVEPSTAPARVEMLESHTHGTPAVSPGGALATCTRCLHQSSLMVAIPMDDRRFLAASVDLDLLARRIFEQIRRSRSSYIALIDANDKVIYAAGNREQRSQGRWVAGRAEVPDTGLRLEVAAPRSVVAPEVRARVSILLFATYGVLGLLLACIGILVVLKRREDRERIERVRSLAHQDKLATLGMMAASTAHEIRNAIAVARLQLEVAAATADAGEKSRSIEKAVDSVERLSKLAENLSGYAGKGRENAERFELPAAIDEALDVVQPKIKNRARVEVQSDDGLFVYGSSASLVQVIVNLVLNAIDALEGRGEDALVRVRAGRDGDDAVLEVLDNGDGIDPSVLDNIFNPFFSTKDGEAANGGTGIGLWLCSQILEQHNGSISAENLDDDDGGARFVVRIPLDLPSSSGGTLASSDECDAGDDEVASLESA